MYKIIREQIMQLAEGDYQKFSAALLPNTNNVLGVRLPALRRIAKNIAKGDWRSYLETAENEYFEEIMLQGMVIGYIKAGIDEILTYAARFIPKINNWSVCDSFCIGLKFSKYNMEHVWDFLQYYLASNKEFDIRFGVVMLLNYYIEPEYIDRIFVLLNNIESKGYYVKMAVAWAVSICYIKLPEPTMKYLKNNRLDDFTYNKALQKIADSLRISKEAKEIIKSMKRKGNE